MIKAYKYSKKVTRPNSISVLGSFIYVPSLDITMEDCALYMNMEARVDKSGLGKQIVKSIDDGTVLSSIECEEGVFLSAEDVSVIEVDELKISTFIDNVKQRDLFQRNITLTLREFFPLFEANQ